MGSHSHHSYHHHQLKKGPWTSSEDAILVEYVKKHGEGNWNAVQKHSGLYRCGKSCRLRWANHLRPNLKKGAFTGDEERLILELHSKIGNKWARMASQLPGRTDNEIKNYWNTRIKRRQRAGLPLYPPDIQQQFSVSNHQSQTTQIDSSPEHFNANAEGAFCLNSNSDNSVVTFDNPDLPTALPSFFGYGEPSMLQQQPYGEIHHHLKGLRNNSFLKVPLLSTSYPMTSSYGSQVFYPTGIGEMPLSNQQLINGNVTFSASKSYSGFVKMELPSIQLAGSEQPRGPEHNLLNNVGSDALLSSVPLSSQMLANVDSSFEPNANNGLLETLLHEAQAMVVAKIPSMLSPAQSSSDFQGASSCSSSSTTDNVLSIQSKANECRSSDPMSSLEGHAFSMFREASATMGAGLLEKSTSTQSAIGKKIKSEDPSEEPISSNSYEDESFPAIMSYGKLDILSEAEWFNQNSGIVKENTIISGSLSPLSNDDMGVGIQHMPSIAILSNQAWELSSCPWSNMPGVC